MTTKNCILFVNGIRREIVGGSISHCTTAYDYLRDTLDIKSLKFVSRDCGGGSNLGAIIMVTTLNLATGVVDTHRALDALSTPIIALHGTAITTLEGLSGGGGGGQKEGALHPIQARLVASGATQCGYCTPGVCMLLYTLLMNSLQPTIRDVDRALAGVWCRCSGFRAVNDVARSFSVDFDEALKAKLAADDKAITSADGPPPPMESAENYPPLSEQGDSRVIISSATRIAALRRQHPLYPHEHLKPPTLSPVPPLFLYYGTNDSAFLLPSTVDEVIRSSKVVPDYTTVNGFDEFHHQVLSRVHTAEGPPMAVLTTSRVKEMLELTLKMEGTPQAPQATFFIGAAATLGSISQRIPKLITTEVNQKDPWTAAAMLELRTAIDNLSTSQTEENAYTLVGHLMARPCGDLVPLLHCLQATLIVLTSRGREEYSIVEVTGASRSIAKLDVILGLRIPSQKNRFVGYAKATLGGPRAPASSAVALACDVNRRDGDVVANDFTIACAGSSFYLTQLPEVASCLERTNLSSSDTIKNLRVAQDKLLMSLRNLVHGPSDGRVSYRITVTRSLIFRLMCRLQMSVGASPMDGSAVVVGDMAAQNLVSFGVQSWEAAAFGGIMSSWHAIDDEYQMDIVVSQTPTPASPSLNEGPVSSVSSPTTTNSNNQSHTKPPGAGAAGGKSSAAAGKLPPGGPRAQKGNASANNTLSVPMSDVPAAGGAKSPIPNTNLNVPSGPVHRLVTPRTPVGDSLPDIHAVSHALAHTAFIGDTLLPKGCLHAAFVRSTIPMGTIKAVDATAATSLPGVLAFYDVRDLPVRPLSSVIQTAHDMFQSGRKAPLGAVSVEHGASAGNLLGSKAQDAPPIALPDDVLDIEAKERGHDGTQPTQHDVFARKEVHYIGQLIGIVVATSATTALQAAKMVSVEYVKDHRVAYMLSIAESREAKAFFPTEAGNLPTTQQASGGGAATGAGSGGNAAKSAGAPIRKLFENKDLNTYSGTFSIGGQFAMTQQPASILAFPGTDDRLEVRVTTENASRVQKLIANSLILPSSSIVVSVPKLGGPQAELPMVASMSTAVSLASWKLRRPVCFVSSLEDDTASRGLSPSATIDWRCAVDPVTSGLQGIDVQVYLNCGSHKGNNDETLRVILAHVSGGYHIPLIRARGVLCRTNYAPMTAHVGAAPAIGTLIIENIMDVIARNMKVPRWKLQEAHLMTPNEVLPYGQLPHHIRLPTVWQDTIIAANVGDRMMSVHLYNQANRFRKRGIAMVPILVGCRLPIPDDEEHCGTAVVTARVDGTVHVRHGVTDCGLGVDTKVVQVVARAFGISTDLVRVASMPSTEGIDVSGVSATHLCADVACVAALNACEVIKQRFQHAVMQSSHRCATGTTLPTTLGERVRLATSFCIPMVAIGFAKTKRTDAQLALLRADRSMSSPARRGGELSGGAGGSPTFVSIPDMDHMDSPTSPSPHSYDGGAGGIRLGVLGPTPTLHEPFSYFVQGAACAEVELDVLTGAHRIRRADIVIDAGQSLNPLIDTVIAESQFVKGAGWLTTEEIIMGDAVHPDIPEGTFLNAGLKRNSSYVIPRLHDAVPQDLRVTLFGGATSANTSAGVHGAKSIVEASLATGSAVMFALREAVYAARAHWTEVRPPFLEMHAPLTAERLRMACTDEFSQGTYGGAECQVVGSY